MVGRGQRHARGGPRAVHALRTLPTPGHLLLRAPSRSCVLDVAAAVVAAAVEAMSLAAELVLLRAMAAATVATAGSDHMTPLERLAAMAVEPGAAGAVPWIIALPPLDAVAVAVAAAVMPQSPVVMGVVSEPQTVTSAPAAVAVAAVLVAAAVNPP